MSTILDLAKGARARVIDILSEDKDDFIEIGLVPGVEVRLMQIAPFGEPYLIEYQGNKVSLNKAAAGLLKINDLK